MNPHYPNDDAPEPAAPAQDLRDTDIHDIFESVRRPDWQPGEIDQGLVVRFARALLSARSAVLSPAPAQEEISEEEIERVARAHFGCLVDLPSNMSMISTFARALLARRSKSGRDAALEEAALVCERWGEARLPTRGGNALRNVAVDIRALKGQRS